MKIKLNSSVVDVLMSNMRPPYGVDDVASIVIMKVFWMRWTT